MKKLSRRSVLQASAISFAATSIPKWSAAQIASYTPDDLKGVLTPFGAIRAGNADGSIPAWTGGYSEVSPGYQQGDSRPVPFSDEKPLFSITSSNVSQYQDKLSAGALEMFQKHPDFRMDVYPTHRTAVAPQYVYDYIYKNASNASLSADGNAVVGAYGGIPFPIPKNGHEIIWNHLLVWQGTTTFSNAAAYTITSTGDIILETIAKAWFQYPYYFQNGEASFDGFYQQVLLDPTAPPYEAGGAILNLGPLNPILAPSEAWVYLEGQRRVRRAPEFEYDTPTGISGGTTNWDEIQIFSGKLNEYDCEYIGTKEIYVPYNSNKAIDMQVKDQYLTHFVSPDMVRWELHRVRIVNMTLKPGARNVDVRRTVYCDEDTGSALLGEIYDAQGSLWKFQHVVPAIFPDIPCVHAGLFFTLYDFHSGTYSVSDAKNNEMVPVWKVIPPLPPTFYTPGELVANAGIF